MIVSIEAKIVKYCAKDGSKGYKMFMFHVQAIESPYCNTYMGLNMVKPGNSRSEVKERVNRMEVPSMKITMIDKDEIKTQPPSLEKISQVMLPVPKGHFHITMNSIEDIKMANLNLD